jgi:hypothetical protein
MTIKSFNWLPNLDEALPGIEYDFIEISIHHFRRRTAAGNLVHERIETNRANLAARLDEFMPIIHFNPHEDKSNCLVFHQGRHRTEAATYFSDHTSKIVVMVPRDQLREIIAVLDSEIISRTPNKYPEHAGIFYELKTTLPDSLD